jgi:hypothetical protein
MILRVGFLTMKLNLNVFYAVCVNIFHTVNINGIIVYLHLGVVILQYSSPYSFYSSSGSTNKLITDNILENSVFVFRAL